MFIESAPVSLSERLRIIITKRVGSRDPNAGFRYLNSLDNEILVYIITLHKGGPYTTSLNL
jgi:hypothetical protein